jgi:RNA polymerase sigma factor (sigma-70 family)
VADHGEIHALILTLGGRRSLEDGEVSVPPFEHFYEQHRDEIFAFLVRRLGADRAEDAFQETFLRALRAYPDLRHGEHLRAWAFTIAGRIVIDEHRRSCSTEELQEFPAEDERPAFAELEHLAQELPPTERAAVVLRYGYDLDYADIGAALGSNATAARQAASAGIRRLRKKELKQ